MPYTDFITCFELKKQSYINFKIEGSTEGTRCFMQNFHDRW